MTSVHVVDYVIFVVSILASFAIGLYYAFAANKNKTTEDYLLASRRMNMVPIAISFMASFFSAISILGNPSEVYYYGIEYWFAVFSWLGGVVLTSVTYVPLLHPLKLTSLHKYLWLRYKSKPLVYIASVIQCTSLSLVNGIVIFGPAIVLQSMADIPIWTSILVWGLVSTIYTSIGGFQAVIWSDVFQAVIIFIGLVTVNIIGTVKVGGIANVWKLYGKKGRLSLNWSLSPFTRSTVWIYAFGFLPFVTLLYSASQVSVQRICSLPSVQHARKSMFLAIVPYIIVVSLTCTSGVVAFAYYTHIGCDPLKNGLIHNHNQIIPHFIKEVLNYPSVPGIFMACIACGTLSNLSSNFNSISAMVWDDILQEKLKDKHLTEQRKALITKIISFIAGVLATAAGFVISQIGGTLIQITFTVATASLAPIWIFVTLGALSTRTSWKTAVIGGIIAPAIILWLNIGRTVTGMSHAVLHAGTDNCTSVDDVTVSYYVNNNGNEIVNNVSYVVSDNVKLEVHNMTETLLGDSSNIQHSAFFLYKMSFVLVTPLGLGLGLLVGLLFSLIPGFRNNEDVDIKLLFPCIRYVLEKRGYLNMEKNVHGMYVINQKKKYSIEDHGMVYEINGQRK